MRKALLIAIALLLTVPFAQAQKMETDFASVPTYPNAVKPSAFVYEAKPGTVIQDSITVKNNSDAANTLYIYGVDSTLSSGGKTAFMKRGEEMSSLGVWVKFESEKFEFTPQETKTLGFTITIPEDAELKDYTGGIALEKFYAAQSGGSVNHALRLIKNIELKITNEPKEIPKQIPAAESAPFQPTPFFWITIGIFVVCVAYLIISSRKKHAKKHH